MTKPFLNTFLSRPNGLTKGVDESHRCFQSVLKPGRTPAGHRFTNRRMWQVLGVKSPIWGYTTSRTTHELANVPVMGLNDFSEPRIEPEIMFGFIKGAEVLP